MRSPDSVIVAQGDASGAGGKPGSSGNSYMGSGNPSPPAHAGGAHLETLKRLNRENCARAAQGANVRFNP